MLAASLLGVLEELGLEVDDEGGTTCVIDGCSKAQGVEGLCFGHCQMDPGILRVIRDSVATTT